MSDSSDEKADDVVAVMTQVVNVRREIVDDILCAAFEGGITYWCKKVEVVNDDYKGADYAHDVISRGGSIIVFDGEDGDWDGEGTPHTLTLNNFLKGLEVACKNYGKTVESLYDNHDAEVADVVVQGAIFGEIIYG